MMRGKKTHSPTERIGVNAVERVVVEQFEWIFREQHVADFGIDAHIEIVSEGKPTGRLIAAQIKTGTSYFKGTCENVVFYVDHEHMKYWENHCLPVILILHNPEAGQTLWQWADLRGAKQTDKGWRIDVPRTHLFDSSAANDLADRGISDPEFERRMRFVVDKKLMQEVNARETYVTIDDWVNKTWHIRQIELRFDDMEKDEPDYIIPVLVTWGYDVKDVMEHFLPWLDYEYAKEIEDGSGEVEGHTFEVSLSKEANAFLLAEDYFANGLPKKTVKVPEDDDENISWFE